MILLAAEEFILGTYQIIYYACQSETQGPQYYLGTESSLAPHKEKHNILTFRIKTVDSPEASRCCADVGSEDDSNGIALGHKTAGWVEATEPTHRG